MLMIRLCRSVYEATPVKFVSPRKTHKTRHWYYPCQQRWKKPQNLVPSITIAAEYFTESLLEEKYLTSKSEEISTQFIYLYIKLRLSRAKEA